MDRFIYSRMDKHREGRKHIVWVLVFFLLLLFNVFERLSFEPIKAPAKFTVDLTFYIAGILFIYFLIKKRYELEDYAFLFIGVGSYLVITVIIYLINCIFYDVDGFL